MKKLEIISSEFAKSILSKEELRMVKGGTEGSSDTTTYTSRTTGWKYPDHYNAQGELVVDYDKGAIH